MKKFQVLWLAAIVSLSPMIGFAQFRPVLPPSIRPGRIKRPDVPTHEKKPDIIKLAAAADGVFTAFVGKTVYTKTTAGNPPTHTLRLQFHQVRAIKGKFDDKLSLTWRAVTSRRPYFAQGAAVLVLTKNKMATLVIDRTPQNVSHAKAGAGVTSTKPTTKKPESPKTTLPVIKPPTAKPAIAVGVPGPHGIAAKLRPLVRAITAADPLRIAVHFESPTGPIDRKHEMAYRTIDRTATIKSFVFNIEDPRGKSTQLRTGSGSASFLRGSVMGNPTFFVEIENNSLKLLHKNGSTEAKYVCKGEPFMPRRGEFKISVSGQLIIKGTRSQPVLPIPFKVGPVHFDVKTSGLTFKSMSDLESAARQVALRSDKSIEKPELLTIDDERDQRVFRFRGATAETPGYQRYEVIVDTAGTIMGVKKEFIPAKKGAWTPQLYVPWHVVWSRVKP